MKVIIISFFLAIIIYSASQFLNINNVLVNHIINQIPVLISLTSLYFMIPKNHLKLMVFYNKNVKYSLKTKYNNVSLTLKEYTELIENMKKNSSVKIVNNNFGDHLFSTVVNWDSVIVEIKYHIQDMNLLLSVDSKSRFSSFYKDCKIITKNINDSFTSSSFKFSDMLADLRIVFEPNTKIDSSPNPFVQNIFTGFDQKQCCLDYVANNNSKVRINNNTIQFYSNDLESLVKDYRKEMRLFYFMN